MLIRILGQQARRACGSVRVNRPAPRLIGNLRFTRCYSSEENSTDPRLEPREADNVDLVIVGAGPAGLAAAIRYKQLDIEHGDGEKRVVVLEKASEIGGHQVSGVILEPRALDELLPDWREGDIPPLFTPVTSESMKFLAGSKLTIPLPEPPLMKNKGKNYVGSLSSFMRWLGEKAEEVGVEVYPGFSVSEIIKDENGRVKGIATSDMGVARDGTAKDSFARGMEFHAPITLLAEGCHGSLSKQIISSYDLRSKAGASPQTYGLGIKEVWEVPAEFHKKGYVAHTVGFPNKFDTYGGGFIYHFGDNLVSVGLVLGLDYKNPYISPYQEFQKMKTHPFYADVLSKGRCIAYGARALNEGGYQSIPHLAFPGGGLIGCSAGFVNVVKIKGTHTAMKSGMVAAELAFKEPENFEATYDQAIRDSWVGKELWEVRNVRPSFNTPLKLYGMLGYSGLDTFILRGKTPWTLKHNVTDAAETADASSYKPIEYPKPDGKLTFDLLTSVSRTGTYHDEDEPCHLRVPNQDLQKHASLSWPKYKGIEQRFCPAGVYEYIEADDAQKDTIPEFKINSQNCIHCKTCDIKVPTQDITWTVPEGGDGPKYTVT